MKLTNRKVPLASGLIFFVMDHSLGATIQIMIYDVP